LPGAGFGTASSAVSFFDTTVKILHDLQKREVKPSAQKYFIFPKGRNYDLKNSARLDTGT
jgi:hypothetical protein